MDERQLLIPFLTKIPQWLYAKAKARKKRTGENVRLQIRNALEQYLSRD